MTATNPDHYKNHPTVLECIDLIRYMPCPIANLIKYLWRWEKKDGVQDLEKALVYLNWIDPTTVQQLREVPERTPMRANISIARQGLMSHYDRDEFREDPLFFVLLWLSYDLNNWEHLYTARNMITQTITELQGKQA